MIALADHRRCGNRSIAVTCTCASFLLAWAQFPWSRPGSNRQEGPTRSISLARFASPVGGNPHNLVVFLARGYRQLTWPEQRRC
jgi:hypothetical protein